jgi:hypothetical protein
MHARTHDSLCMYETIGMQTKLISHVSEFVCAHVRKHVYVRARACSHAGKKTMAGRTIVQMKYFTRMWSAIKDFVVLCP